MVDTQKEFLPKKAQKADQPNFLWIVPPLHVFMTGSGQKKMNSEPSLAEPSVTWSPFMKTPMPWNSKRAGTQRTSCSTIEIYASSLQKV